MRPRSLPVRNWRCKDTGRIYWSLQRLTVFVLVKDPSASTSPYEFTHYFVSLYRAHISFRVQFAMKRNKLNTKHSNENQNVHLFVTNTATEKIKIKIRTNSTSFFVFCLLLFLHWKTMTTPTRHCACVLSHCTFRYVTVRHKMNKSRWEGDAGQEGDGGGWG